MEDYLTSSDIQYKISSQKGIKQATSKGQIDLEKSQNKDAFSSKRKVTWEQKGNRRSSQQSSKKSLQSISLRVNSKGDSLYVVENEDERNKKLTTLSDYILQREVRVISIVKSTNQPQELSPLLHKNSQYVDDREQKICLHKQKSNIAYLIAQTKQLLQLTKALILKQQCKQLKNEIIKTQLKVRRLRICSRKKYVESRQNRQQNIRQQYYESYLNRKPQQRQSVKNNSLHSKNKISEYYDTSQLYQLKKQRSNLLQTRVSNLKLQIQQQKCLIKQKQRLIEEEIGLLKKQSKSYQKTNKQLNNCSLGLQSRISALEINTLSQNRQNRFLTSSKNKNKLSSISPAFGQYNGMQAKCRQSKKQRNRKQNRKSYNYCQNRSRNT